MTWIQRKTSVHQDLGAQVRAQLLLSVLHGVMNQVVISHCFSQNHCLHVVPFSEEGFFLVVGIWELKKVQVEFTGFSFKYIFI